MGKFLRLLNEQKQLLVMEGLFETLGQLLLEGNPESVHSTMRNIDQKYNAVDPNTQQPLLNPEQKAESLRQFHAVRTPHIGTGIDPARGLDVNSALRKDYNSHPEYGKTPIVSAAEQQKVAKQPLYKGNPRPVLKPRPVGVTI